MIALQVRKPDFRALHRDGRAFERANLKAANRAVDRASRVGHRKVRMDIRAAGLGKLDRAVGHSSSLKKGERTALRPWGVIFAKGQNKSDDRGAGALEIYSQGGAITPKRTMFQTGWLWIATNRIPSRVRRFRMTPALYNRSPLVASIGPLQFKRISASRALLVVKKVQVSAKTGRAKAQGKRKSKTQIRMKEIVAFVGIKITRRMKRFDQHRVMEAASRMVPRLHEMELKQGLSREG